LTKDNYYKNIVYVRPTYNRRWCL